MTTTDVGDEQARETAALACQSAQFPIPYGVRYLNCAYMAPLSRVVERAGRDGLLRQRDPSTVGLDMYFEGVDRVRRAFGGLIGIDDWERVAVVPSVSYGLQIVAQSTRAEQGHNVVVIDEEFPSAVLPWHRMAMERRIIVRTVPAPRDATPETRARRWNDAIIAAIDGSTAVVMLAPVHWCDGTRFDLARIAARARAVGADVVIDGTQAIGALPFVFGDVQPDAVVCAGYKWLLGGYGMTLAYIGPKYDGGAPLEENWTSQVGSDDFAALSEYAHEYRQGAGRYDGGQRAQPVLIPMMEAALAQIEAWGVGRIQRYCESVIAPLRERAGELGIIVDRSPESCSHIVGVRFADGRGAPDVGRSLAARGVHVSVRGDVIRVAPHVYNTSDDVDALIDALRATV